MPNGRLPIGLIEKPLHVGAVLLQGVLPTLAFFVLQNDFVGVCFPRHIARRHELGSRFHNQIAERILAITSGRNGQGFVRVCLSPLNGWTKLLKQFSPSTFSNYEQN